MAKIRRVDSSVECFSGERNTDERNEGKNERAGTRDGRLSARETDGRVGGGKRETETRKA